MKNLFFIFLFFGLKAASQTAFPLYLPGSSNTDSIKQVVTVNGSPRQVYNIDLVKFQAAKAAHDTATILRLLIPTNNNQLTNGAGFITSSALTPYLTSANAASTYQPIGSYLTGSNTISINGSSQTLGSNPSFTVSGGGSSSSVVAPVWNRRGVVVSPENTADQNNAFEPNVILDSTTSPVILTGHTKVFRMWFTTGWSAMNINYAESLDGVNWTKYSGNPVVTGHRCSFVLKNGSTFIMYTATNTGTQIDRYTSTDGAAWTLTNAGVVVKNTATWNASGVFNTSVINDNGTWRMLVDGGVTAGTNYSQGYYTSPDGITWTSYASNPVLTGVNQGATFLKKIGSTYYVWCGVSESATNNLPSDMTRYQSTNMINWTRSFPGYSMPRRTTDEGPFTAVGQLTDAYLTAVDTSVYLYYSASQDGSQQVGKLQVKLAIAPMSFSSLTQTNEGDGSILPPAMGKDGQVLYGVGGGINSDASLTYSSIGTRASQNVASLRLVASPTAVVINDTLTAAYIINNANASGLSNIKTYDLKINKTFLNFDNLFNISIGNGAAAQPSTSNSGTFFVGNGAGATATSAYNSNFIGPSAGQGATSANNSNFVGGSAGNNATSASLSNFFGNSAGLNATGASNSNFFGNNAGKVASTSSAANSNFLGNSAGLNATGASNSNFFGSAAGSGATSAQQSNFFGNSAGNGATGALLSNFFGSSSGSGATGASYSNFFGFNTGTSGTHVITGTNNILIGTNITTPTAASTGTLNIGGVLYGSGLYGTTSGNPTAAAQTAGKIAIAKTIPASTLDVNGSFSVAYIAQTATYTATATDHTIDCSGTFTVTLPTAIGITGRIYVVKNSGAGTITMAGTSAQTFDGAASPTIAPGAVSQYQSNGANWIKIN